MYDILHRSLPILILHNRFCYYVAPLFDSNLLCYGINGRVVGLTALFF